MENMQQLANVIGVDVGVKEAVKVARRLGAKKGDESRPLQLVFKNVGDREKFLSNAPKLNEAVEPWKQVNVVVDLTARQRQEDSDVKKEADKRNNEMEENEAKNFLWKVVGSRGARRLMKVKKEEDKTERGRLRSQRK